MSTALREAHVVLVRGSEGRLHFQSCLNLGTRDGISPSRVPFNSLTAHGPTSAYLFPYNSSYGPGTIWMPFTGARKCVSLEETGLAVTVKPVAVIVNFT